MGKDKEVGALEVAAEEETLALGAVFIKDSELKEIEMSALAMAKEEDPKDITMVNRCAGSTVLFSINKMLKNPFKDIKCAVDEVVLMVELLAVEEGTPTDLVLANVACLEEEA